MIVAQSSRRRLWIALAWLGVAAVVVGSLIPVSQDGLAEGQDKLVHAAMYGILMGCFCRAYPDRRRWAAWAGGLIALGVVLEFLQGWTGTRSCDPWDMLANGSGVAAVWLGLGLQGMGEKKRP